MSIREMPLPSDSPVPRLQRLLSITIDANVGLTATWVIDLPNGKRQQRSVRVSDALTALIVARATFKAVLDQIASDTQPVP